MPRILVVYDDEDITFLLRTMLEKKGHNVVEVRSGEECLEKVEAEKPDLIFLDIIMPGIGGWEVCRRIKERSHEYLYPCSHSCSASAVLNHC